MKLWAILILVLFMVVSGSIVFAQSYPNFTYGANMTDHGGYPDPFFEKRNKIFNDPEQAVRDYCNNMNTRVLWLLGILFFMYLAQAKVKDGIDNSEFTGYANFIMFIYKWLFLGMLFIVGLAIWLQR